MHTQRVKKEIQRLTMYPRRRLMLISSTSQASLSDLRVLSMSRDPVMVRPMPNSVPTLNPFQTSPALNNLMLN